MSPESSQHVSADAVAKTRPANIDEGIPETQAHWPDGVIPRLALLAQGVVVRRSPLFYYADPSKAVWARTEAYIEGSDGPEVVEVDDGNAPTYGIITSQTCDVVEEGKDRPINPWVQVAPVYDRSDLNSGLRRLLRNGSGPQHLYYLPGLADGFWVADLRIEFPVEKGWVAHCETADGFTNDEQRRKFGLRLAWRRSRPAFAEVIVEQVQKPLAAGLLQLSKEHEDFYAAMDDQVEEVAIRCSDHLAPTSVGVTVLLKLEAEDDVRAWWERWWDETRARCDEAGLNLLPLDMRLMSQVSVDEYKRMTVLPLARVSPE